MALIGIFLPEVSSKTICLLSGTSLACVVYIFLTVRLAVFVVATYQHYSLCFFSAGEDVTMSTMGERHEWPCHHSEERSSLLNVIGGCSNVCLVSRLDSDLFGWLGDTHSHGQLLSQTLRPPWSRLVWRDNTNRCLDRLIRTLSSHHCFSIVSRAQAL